MRAQARRVGILPVRVNCRGRAKGRAANEYGLRVRCGFMPDSPDFDKVKNDWGVLDAFLMAFPELPESCGRNGPGEIDLSQLV